MKPVTSLALTAAVLMGGGSLFAAAPVSADPMHISCPVSQVRREITTHLPSGWWNTPIVNGLTDTDIQTIGGKLTLVCRYGPAGQIMHLAPPSMPCTAVPGGFECTPPAPHPVHSTGSVNIPQTYIVDLDTGHLNASGPGDLWFQAATATQLFLTPVNGARMDVGGHTARGWAGCASASYSTARAPIGAVLGHYVCVRANSGRIGEVKVVNMLGGGIKTLVVNYRTWD